MKYWIRRQLLVVSGRISLYPLPVVTGCDTVTNPTSEANNLLIIVGPGPFTGVQDGDGQRAGFLITVRYKGAIQYIMA